VVKRNKMKRCWYCQKRPRKSGNSLFCRVCEKIRIKETVRTSFENAQSPKFGKGTRGLGI
jgi:hypothetical protein